MKLMRKYSLSHGRDGYALHVYDVPWWGEPFENIAMRVIHPVANRCPEQLAKLPIGKPDYSDGIKEDDGSYWNARELGSRLWDLWQWPAQFVWRRTTVVARINLTMEQARNLEPEWVEEMDSIWSDTADERMEYAKHYFLRASADAEAMLDSARSAVENARA